MPVLPPCIWVASTVEAGSSPVVGTDDSYSGQVGGVKAVVFLTAPPSPAFSFCVL